MLRNGKKGWNEEDCIKESKYHIRQTGFFNYDNSNKRGKIDNQCNRFTILESNKTEKSKVSSQIGNPILTPEDNLHQLIPHVRVIGHLIQKNKGNLRLICIEEGPTLKEREHLLLNWFQLHYPLL